MVKINWTPQSIEDIHNIREYYQDKSEKYSEQLTDKFFEKAELLEKHPLIGRIVPELDKSHLREIIYKNYRIIYRVVSDKRLDILTIHNSFRPLSDESIFE